MSSSDSIDLRSCLLNCKFYKELWNVQWYFGHDIVSCLKRMLAHLSKELVNYSIYNCISFLKHLCPIDFSEEVFHQLTLEFQSDQWMWCAWWIAKVCSYNIKFIGSMVSTDSFYSWEILDTDKFIRVRLLREVHPSSQSLCIYMLELLVSYDLIKSLWDWV